MGIYIDMQMFKIDKPEDCACGLSLDAKNDAPQLVANTNHVFQLHDAEVLSVSFIVWDIENGVKLRDISSFALAPSINTADYLATLLTNAASAVRHLAGFYGHVNDFNPGDWIVNRTREVTMMCFATVTTYYETTGNKYTCNENLVQGDILAVPLCDAQGLLDEDGYTATYPERIWREIPTPRFNYEVAAGSSNPNGNGPGGSHPTDWYNFEGTGPGRCNVSTDCPGNYFCDLSDGKCQMCITDVHCARLGTPEFPAECVANNAYRLCDFDIDTDLPDPTPGAPRPGVWSTASPGARASTAPTVAVSIAVTLTIAVSSFRLLPPTRRSATRLPSATTSSSRPKSRRRRTRRPSLPLPRLSALLP